MNVVQRTLEEVKQLLFRKVLARFKDLRRGGVWSWERGGLAGKPENRRFLVRALSICREAFSIKTELRLPLMRRVNGPSPWWRLLRCWI